MSIPNTITIKNKKSDLDKLIEYKHQINKSNAAKNTEILLDILNTLEQLTDRLKDIELNSREVYLYVKKKQELEKENKQGWFT
jgi:hypothetical protein